MKNLWNFRNTKFSIHDYSLWTKLLSGYQQFWWIFHENHINIGGTISSNVSLNPSFLSKSKAECQTRLWLFHPPGHTHTVTQVCSWGIFDKGCQRHKKSEKWKENKNKRLSVLNCSIIIGGNLTQYQTSLVGTWDSTWTFFPAYYSTHVFHMCSIQTSSHSIFEWWTICRNIVHVHFIY